MTTTHDNNKAREAAERQKLLAWTVDMEKRLIKVGNDEGGHIRNTMAEAACLLIAVRSALTASEAKTEVSEGWNRAALKLMDNVDDLIRWASCHAPAHLYKVSSGSFWKVCHMLASAPSSPALDAAKVRDAALEEAAKICEGLAVLYDGNVGFDTGYSMAAKRAANEIRALKSSPSEAQQPVQQDGWVSETLQRWASWILINKPELFQDHACKRCVPHSDMLVDGFSCVYHEARDVVGGLPPAPIGSGAGKGEET